MAQIQLPDGILAIHGRLGDKIYRSRKQPDGTYKVFVHEAPKRKSNGPTSVQCASNVLPSTLDKQ